MIDRNLLKPISWVFSQRAWDDTQVRELKGTLFRFDNILARWTSGHPFYSSAADVLCIAYKTR